MIAFIEKIVHDSIRFIWGMFGDRLENLFDLLREKDVPNMTELLE